MSKATEMQVFVSRLMMPAVYVHLGNETKPHTNTTAYIIKRKVRQHIRRFSELPRKYANNGKPSPQ